MTPASNYSRFTNNNNNLIEIYKLKYNNPYLFSTIIINNQTTVVNAADAPVKPSSFNLPDANALSLHPIDNKLPSP
jgi:hypothetical protein